MTPEREAMTERQAFEKFWSERMRNVPLQGPVPTPKELSYNAWQAAIAHLSRAAEPIGWAKDFGDEETRVSWSRQPPEFGKGGWWLIYANPFEPARDVRDAARYRWLRDRMYRFEIEAGVLDSKAFAQRPRIGYGREIDSAIDNAMTKENGND